MVDNSLLNTTTRTGVIETVDTFESNNFFGLKMPADFLSIGYACIVALGGIIGYAKAGSVPSLIAGLGFGAVLGVGAYFTSANPRHYHLLLGTFVVKLFHFILFLIIFNFSFFIRKKNQKHLHWH